MGTQRDERIGRRRFLVGAAGGALAASAAVVVGCDEEEQEPAADWNGQVVSRFVNANLPDDPDAALWRRGPQVLVPMTPQTSAIPFKPQPSVPRILVRSIYNNTKVGFLLEWTDARRDDRVVKTTEFRDGCGVSIGPGKAPAAFLTMGTAAVPASILYWRADWQKDIDEGFQDLEAAFPNVAFDFYPPLVDAPRPLPINDGYAQEGRQWLVGWNAGNPLSQPTKTSSVEKLLGRGPGTLAHLPTQDATGAGVWKDGRWKVMLVRNLAAADEGETALAAGGEYALLFTVWSGADQDRGSRKSPSGMGKLLLEQA